MKTSLILLAVLVTAMSAIGDKSGDVPSVANSINALAFDLYGKLRTEDGNLFFSPYSISTALAMTWAGARGATEQEMAKTLHFDLGQDRLHPACGQLVERLNAAGKAGDFELAVANRLWGQSDYKILPDFQKTVKTFYGADIAPADFKMNAEGVRKEINGWVEKKTKDKIKDLLQPRRPSSAHAAGVGQRDLFQGRLGRDVRPGGDDNPAVHARKRQEGRRADDAAGQELRVRRGRDRAGPRIAVQGERAFDDRAAAARGRRPESAGGKTDGGESQAVDWRGKPQAGGCSNAKVQINFAV